MQAKVKCSESSAEPNFSYLEFVLQNRTPNFPKKEVRIHSDNNFLRDFFMKYIFLDSIESNNGDKTHILQNKDCCTITALQKTKNENYNLFLRFDLELRGIEHNFISIGVVILNSFFQLKTTWSYFDDVSAELR